MSVAVKKFGLKQVQGWGRRGWRVVPRNCDSVFNLFTKTHCVERGKVSSFQYKKINIYFLWVAWVYWRGGGGGVWLVPDFEIEAHGSSLKLPWHPLCTHDGPWEFLNTHQRPHGSFLKNSHDTSPLLLTGSWEFFWNTAQGHGSSLKLPWHLLCAHDGPMRGFENTPKASLSIHLRRFRHRNRMIVSVLSAGAYTTTLYVMVDIGKGEGDAPPPRHQPGLIFP